MKTLLTLAFLALFAYPAWAGIGVCHDGNGNIVRLDERANPVFYKNTAGCVYYEVWKDGLTDDDYTALRNLIKTVPRKHIKFGLSGKPEEMTQPEKDNADSAEIQLLKDAEIAKIDELNVSIKDVLMALVKRVNARLPADKQITKEEVVQQIKKDRGL
jgi:hypothetical protein